ncbi:hypothetical protein BMF35_a1091 [Aurantiacibacter gangjinensis]|nr:hypothetical protein BMF35_a1091 [Aurantiacibacter gangjinensis]
MPNRRLRKDIGVAAFVIKQVFKAGAAGEAWRCKPWPSRLQLGGI